MKLCMSMCSRTHIQRWFRGFLCKYTWSEKKHNIFYFSCMRNTYNFFVLKSNYFFMFNSPNHACCSPCTSIARPKSASLTAAPLALLASSKFSGCKKNERFAIKYYITHMVVTLKMRHGKTELKIFIIVIPKEGLGGGVLSIVSFGMTATVDL